MDSNLLKEAIADAKAVRQTALANAKVALEEAFSEKYQAMFSEKLKEDANQGNFKSNENDVVNAGGAQVQKEQQDVSEQEIDELIKELESEVGEEPKATGGDVDDIGAGSPPVDAGSPPVPGADAPVDDIGAAGASAPTAPATPPPPGFVWALLPSTGATPADGAGAGAPPVPPSPVDGAGAPPVDAGSPPSEVPPVGQEDTDEDINLDELLESLKEEVEKDEKEEEDTVNENAPVKSSGIAPGNNKAPSADAQKSSHISDASKNIRSGKVGYPDGKKIVFDPETVNTSKENFGDNKSQLCKTAKMVKETVETGTPGGKVTAKEPTEADRPNLGDHVTKTDLSTPALAKENAMLQSQLNEAESTIKYVKTQLNEINLLNAKLLYTNKLFKEYAMNNEHKMRIVEMFDLSKTVREVKLTYANIAESLNFGGKDMKKKVAPATNSTVQSITEGLASKPVGSTKPSREIISESRSAMVSQFQKLAGIKKK